MSVLISYRKIKCMTLEEFENMKVDRKKIYNKFGGRCAYCGHKITLQEMQVDHIIPRRHFEMNGKSMALANEINNLNPACPICNHYKNATPLEEFRNWLLGELHIRLKKLPKRTKLERTIRRKEYLSRVCERYEISEEKPFDRVFYFEKEKGGER